MTNEFRIDKLEEIADATPADYRVPCGMNSIVYLGRVHPSRTTVIFGLPKLPVGYIYLVSKWSEAKRDYTGTETIKRK